MNQTDNPEKPKGDESLRDTGGFNELARASRGGIFSRLGDRFSEALQQGRGDARRLDADSGTRTAPFVSTDPTALRRPRNATTRRMVIPEGVTIEGSLTGSADAEIGGRVEGNVTVEGPLFLLKDAVVTGNVRAGSCQLDGTVEGRIDAATDLIVGKTGRLNADGAAGRNIDIAGQVNGSVTTPGRLRMISGSVVNGDVRVHVLLMEEGAALNGVCTMRTPPQKPQNAAAPQEQTLL